MCSFAAELFGWTRKAMVASRVLPAKTHRLYYGKGCASLAVITTAESGFKRDSSATFAFWCTSVIGAASGVSTIPLDTAIPFDC